MMAHRPPAYQPITWLIRQQKATVAAGNFLMQKPTNVHPGYKKIKEIQKKWMYKYDDSTPVHLKGGSFDQLLFGATVVGCVAGVGMVAKTAYDLVFPKKLT